jgi:hypothetical protein
MELPEDPEEEGEHQVHLLLVVLEQTIQDQHNKGFLVVQEVLHNTPLVVVVAQVLLGELQHQRNLVQVVQDILLQ